MSPHRNKLTVKLRAKSVLNFRNKDFLKNIYIVAAWCMGVVAWSMIRSEVILAWGVEGGADAGARGEVFHFYISLVVVKW